MRELNPQRALRKVHTMSKRFFRGLIVLAASVLLASGAVAQAPFTTTTIVNGNLSPIGNGAALLSAVAAATPPALIKVEPGEYDLNGGQLVMKDEVDIEGSGRGITVITSSVPASGSNATVVAPSHIRAELRGLTARNESIGHGTAVRIESDFFLLTGVNVETQVGLGGIGVDVSNSNTVINDVFARILGTGPNIGFRLNGGMPVIGGSFSYVVSPSWRNTAMEINGDTNTQIDQFFAIVSNSGDDYGVVIRNNAVVSFRNARITAIATELDINPYTYGIYTVGNVTLDIKESTITTKGDTISVALQLHGTSRGKVTGSTLISEPAMTPHSYVYAVRLDSAATLDANQSNFESTAAAAGHFGTGVANFGASRLVGSISAAGTATFNCIFSYNGSYAARAANCL
ncbi:MAG: hypothetical protein AAGC60_23330 [Acidobacteriota bacterium]